MEDNMVNKSKRDLMLERLSAKYPDKEFANDEAMYDQIGADYDDYDNQLNGYKEREKSFSDLYTSDPRTARVMMAWKDGQDPVVTLIQLYGDDLKAALEDPDKAEEIAQANKEYLERVAKSDQLEQEYNENIPQTNALIEEFKNEKGLTDEEVDGLMNCLVQASLDALVGKISRETLEMALKAANYDKGVEEAAQEGEVRGRNSKIRQTLKTPEGDGVPQLNGANNSAESKTAPRSIFDVAAMAK